MTVRNSTVFLAGMGTLLVLFAVLGDVLHANGVRLDGDAALALQVHRVEHLLLALHFARRERSRQLQQAIGERALPMIDMGDDGEIADVLAIHRRMRILPLNP